MNIRTEIRLAVGALLVLLIVTAVSAIVLLTRMSPAVGRILDENASSIEATEAMLVALSTPSTTPQEVTRRRAAFEQALARASANVTEPDEEAHLEAIERLYPSVFADAGDVAARAELVGEVEALAEINHAAMVETDLEARRLGRAGAWAAVFLSIGGFFASVIIVRRLSRRILEPVRELHDTALAWQRGDPHRRCVSHDQPIELLELATVVNTLLDERLQSVHPVAVAEGGASGARRHEHTALLHLLDALPEARLVVSGGEVLAANQSALELLGDAQHGPALRALLGALEDGESGEGGESGESDGGEASVLECEGLRGAWQPLGRGLGLVAVTLSQRPHAEAQPRAE